MSRLIAFLTNVQVFGLTLNASYQLGLAIGLQAKASVNV